MKRQILDATKETYITSLKDRTTGFARVTMRHIIEHLYTNYGRITVEMFTENKTKMKQPWDVTTPIELLFAQINDGQAYATAGGEPYTKPQLVRIGYHNIKVIKRMEIACCEWRAKPAANKTWTKLKLDIKATNLDLGLTVMMDTAGYGAHQAEEQAINEANQTYFANMLDQQTVTTATIATICETMKLLSNQVQELTAKQTPAGNQAAK